jgi:hypothetical protein
MSPSPTESNPGLRTTYVPLLQPTTLCSPSPLGPPCSCGVQAPTASPCPPSPHTAWLLSQLQQHLPMHLHMCYIYSWVTQTQELGFVPMQIRKPAGPGTCKYWIFVQEGWVQLQCSHMHFSTLLWHFHRTWAPSEQRLCVVIQVFLLLESPAHLTEGHYLRFVLGPGLMHLIVHLPQVHPAHGKALVSTNTCVNHICEQKFLKVVTEQHPGPITQQGNWGSSRPLGSR